MGLGRRIDFGLDGEVAIVTGGGSQETGIGNGAAAAIMLARAGARVALVDIDPEQAATTAARIEAEGLEACAYRCDVSREEDCGATVAAVESDLGPVRVLVNNVGVAGPPGTAVEVDLDRWDEDIKVNVKSMVQMSRHVLPGMLRARRGSIVNISSAAGIRGGHPALLYATTKGAIVQLTRAMAAQHGEAGVRVNCVAPGAVYTPMVASGGMSDAERERRRRRSLLKTEGTPWDTGAAVLFLAGEMSRWITGVVLPVDAGYTAGESPPARSIG